jgi:hypothetical protein
MLGLLAVGSLIYTASCSTIGLHDDYRPPARVLAKKAAQIEIFAPQEQDVELANVIRTALTELSMDVPWVVETMAKHGLSISIEHELGPEIAGVFNYGAKSGDQKIEVNANLIDVFAINEVFDMEKEKLLSDRYLIACVKKTIIHELAHQQQYDRGVYAALEHLLPSEAVVLMNFMEIAAENLGDMLKYNSWESQYNKMDRRDRQLLDLSEEGYCTDTYTRGNSIRALFIKYNPSRLPEGGLSKLARDCTQIGPWGNACYSEEAIDKAIAMTAANIPERYRRLLGEMDKSSIKEREFEAAFKANAKTEPSTER